MKQKTIKQLEAEEKKIRKQLREIESQIEKRSLENELPKLRKKYEGKYWKYDNGTDSENRWWLYSYCKKVIDSSEGLFDSFESIKTEYNKEYVFKLDQKDTSLQRQLNSTIRIIQSVNNQDRSLSEIII